MKLEECSENLKPHSTYVLFFPLVLYTEDRISHFHALVVRGSRQRDGGHFRVRRNLIIGKTTRTHEDDPN